MDKPEVHDELPPHLKVRKPDAIIPGGWSGRGTRGIIPYDTFDTTTLIEAVAIINGTSDYYRFDETGRLVALLPPGHTMENYSQHNTRLKEYDALRGRDNTRRLTKLNEQLQETETLLKQAEAELTAADKVLRPLRRKIGDAQQEAVLASAEKVEPLMRRIRALQREQEEAWDLEDLEGPSGQPQTWDPNRLKEMTELSSQAQALTQGFLPNDVDREALETARETFDKVKSRVESITARRDTLKKERDDRQLIEDEAQYDSMKLEFLALCELGDQVTKDQWQRRYDLGLRLDEITVLFEPGKNRTESQALYEAGNKVGLRLGNWSEHAYGDGKNLSPMNAQTLRAVMAILGNVALSNVTEGQDCNGVLRQHFDLHARAIDGGTVFAGLENRFDFLSSHDKDEPIDEFMADATFATLESNIEQLTALQEGLRPDATIAYILPNPKRSARDMDYTDIQAIQQFWDPKMLIIDLGISAKQWWRDHPNSEEYLWRKHNSHPQALDFLLAAKETAFLGRRDGTEGKIENIMSFVNSFWMLQAGDITLSISPELLTRTREILKREPIRESVLAAERL
jgi:hypothetical protein